MGGRKRRLSNETARVLEFIVDRPEREHYGRDLIKETGISSGSLYPILHRLAERDLLIGRWEELDAATAEKRRPRRLYRFNTDQMREAEHLLSEWRTAQRRATPGPIGRPAWQ